MLKSDKIGRGKRQRIQKKIDRIKAGKLKEDLGETGATSDLNPKEVKEKKTPREKVEKLLNKRDEKMNQKANKKPVIAEEADILKQSKNKKRKERRMRAG